MKAIIVKNSKLVKLINIFNPGVRGITLFPFIFVRDEGDDRLINHESIHLSLIHI